MSKSRYNARKSTTSARGTARKSANTKDGGTMEERLENGIYQEDKTGQISSLLLVTDQQCGAEVERLGGIW